MILPEHPQPYPYWHPEYEPIWAAAAANNLPIFFHVASGGVDEAAGTSITGDNVKGIMTAMTMGKKEELDGATLAARTMGGGNIGATSPDADHRRRDQRRRVRAVPGPAAEHDRVQRRLVGELHGHDGQVVADRDRYGPALVDRVLGPGVAAADQKMMGRIFKINDRWPYPLKPSEYVKRNIRVQFADDRVAVHSRHITGVDTIYWGSDYPHAEGTFLGSQDVIEEQFEGVPDEDRAKMLGLTLGKILGLDTSKKLAPVSPPKERVPAPVS